MLQSCRASRKKITNKLCLLFIALFLLCGNLRAHASFGIMPMEVEQKLPTSNRLTDDIEVHNGGEETLFITGSVMDWDLNRTGDYNYSAPGTNPKSCAPWIQLNPSQFTVAPGKSVRVRYTVSAPAPITTAHWAMIFFQSRPLPVKGASQLGVMLSSRVGCKVLLNPAPSPANAGEINDMKVQLADSRQEVQVAVKNPGVTIYRARGTAEIQDEKGNVVSRGALNPAQILPGNTRDLRWSLTEKLPEGTYNLRVQVDVGTRDLLGGELTFKVKAPAVTTP